MDRTKVQKEFNSLGKKLNIDVDPAATGFKKSLLNAVRKQKTAKPSVASKLMDAERRKMKARYKELGQMLADMPDKEERFP